MPTERITWTALPYGVSSAGRAQLSVFVSPRLETDVPNATLALFPDFVDWPAQVRALRDADQLAVELSLGGIVPATLVNPVLDSDLWQMIFSEGTQVCPYRYKTLTGRRIQTYSVGELFRRVKGIYQQQVGFGYSPDRGVVRTREQTRLVEVPVQVDIAITEFVLEMLQRLREEVVERPEDCRGELEWFPNFFELITAIARALADRLGLPDTEPETIAKRFVEIVLTALESPMPQELDTGNLGFFFTPDLLICWLRWIAGQEPNAQLRAFYLLLSQGVDPQMTVISSVMTETRSETVVVPIERPAREYADAVRSNMQNIARDVQAYFAVADGVLHQLPPPDPCEYDFHSLLGSIGQYPEILRRLGIILEVEVDLTAASGDLDVRPAVAWASSTAGMDTFNATPWTASRAERDESGLKAFGTRSRSDGDIGEGFLKLGAAQDYEFTPIDMEGTAFKLSNFSDSLEAMDDAAIYNEIDYVGFPAMRTSGLGLIRNGRLASLQALAAVADQNNALLMSDNIPERVFLDDVVRGFRIDVQDGQQRWRSVCLRDGQFLFANDPARDFNHSDEGWVVPALTQQPGPDGTPKDMLNESIFKWEGWSLTNNRPDDFVDTAGTIQERDELKVEEAERLPFDYTSRVPAGTLPRLRFGRMYRLRVRVADLAGHGRLPTDESGSQTVSPEMIFRRFEPLLTPVLALARALTGDAADLGRSSDSLVIRSLNTALADDVVLTGDVEERYVAPSQVNQLTAEMYGVFDGAIGQGAAGDRAAWYQLIAEKDRGKFPRLADSEDTVIDVTTLNGELLPLPYLPDPAIRSIVLVNLPHAPRKQLGEVDADGVLRYRPPYSDVVGYLGVSITRISVFDGTNYPHAQPFKLALREGKQQPQWDNGTRTLTVYLMKAESANVIVSAAGEMQEHGLLAWFRETLGNATADLERQRDVEDAVRFGLHRMITPGRTIRLLHAVQQPIGRPSIERLRIMPVIGAVYGKLFVDLDSEYWAHALSTVKVHVLGEWTQHIDDLSQPAPVFDVAHQQIVLEQSVYEESDPDLISRPGEILNFVASTTRVGRITRHEFGDTKHRLVRYRLQAINRYRDLFPSEPADPAVAPVYTRDSDEVELNIPNRARPQTPKTILVIPTFRWLRSRNDQEATSERICGLRIYLERPWFSSGDGELLGIVTSARVRDSADVDIETPFQGDEWTEGTPHISHWGADPIWQAHRVWKFSARDTLKPDNVTDNVWAERQVDGIWSDLLLNLAPVSGQADVRVVGYEPQYDTDRAEWFVDIEMRSDDLYFPFIRFALVRYQPQSIPTAHFSEVALTDFAQVLPRRVVTFGGLDQETITISVEGSTYTGRADLDTTVHNNMSRVSAVLQQRLRGLRDADLGWTNSTMPAIMLVPTANPDVTGRVRWTGSLALERLTADREYRVLVTEAEEFEPWADVLGGASYPTERITFVETLNL